MGVEQFRYDGKRVVVSGGATGMGAAIARLVGELGGEVYVLDVKDIDASGVKGIRMDLREREQIDAVVEEVGPPIHALFSCAGVSGAPFSPLDVMLINFVGARHLIESAVERLMPEGSAIAMVSSIGGIGWERRLTEINDLLDTPDYDSARAWCSANLVGEADDAELQGVMNYGWSKQIIDVYVQRRAVPFMRKKIRINATGPGPTVTPLQQATPMWGTFEDQEFKVKMGGLAASTAEQQAYPLVFLCSDAASFISGQVIRVDGGYTAGGLMGVIDAMAVQPVVPSA